MVLPKILREECANCKIGWFLHIPFPSSEIYRMMPVRKELLEGICSANLVGFHTYDYARHFLSSVVRVAALECSPKGVEFGSHFCHLGVFPIGIDPEFFTKLLMTKQSVLNRREELARKFKGKKIILGVDRVDYIKGMPHKLLAMERLLCRYPEWLGQVVLVQIGVPTRMMVEEYQMLSSQVNVMVGSINGQFGTLDYQPVHYINRNVAPEELVSLYNLADVCMVTSVRDGMNLVSHEYVICQGVPPITVQTQHGWQKGVLVLSEFAGSAQSLSGALRVNPWNTEQLATSLNQALLMPPIERELRHQRLHEYISVNTASSWARSFVTDLREAGLNADDALKNVVDISPLPTKSVMKAYKNSKNRLIIIDFDGNLSKTSFMGQESPMLQVLSNCFSRSFVQKRPKWLFYFHFSFNKYHKSEPVCNICFFKGKNKNKPPIYDIFFFWRRTSLSFKPCFWYTPFPSVCPLYLLPSFSFLPFLPFPCARCATCLWPFQKMTKTPSRLCRAGKRWPFPYWLSFFTLLFFY
jgi:trehalose-6-phosphate synthase